MLTTSRSRLTSELGLGQTGSVKTDNLEVGYLMARRRPRGGVAFPPSDDMSEMREELARMKVCENPLRLRLA